MKHSIVIPMFNFGSIKQGADIYCVTSKVWIKVTARKRFGSASEAINYNNE